MDLSQIIYSLIGFGVVLIILTILWMLTIVISQLIKFFGFDKIEEPGSAKTSQVISGETIAVITAAVSFATNGNATIKDIKKLG